MSTDLTQLLEEIDAGDLRAAEKLLPLIYDELRRLAAARLSNEKPGQTLQATALVHEAWIRLAGSEQPWNGRAHFFAAAAEAMRRILIDQARRKSAQKRGAGVEHEELQESRIELKVPTEEFMEINDALDQLVDEDPLGAEIVKLRYFVGMTHEEIADVLGVALRTVNRHWAYARAWLKTTLER